jgi:N-acetylglucosaminyl-diphospho-decaprenol L-rhamnosyltransferase
MSEPITVVVVTFSPGSTLRTFVDTLREATTSPVNIVVVDNGSTDGSIEALDECQGVRLIRTGSNVGYGVAANIGVRETLTDLVVVANPDVEWHPGALDLLYTAAQRWPEGGAFGPLVMTAHGEIYPSARALPTLANGIGHALLGWWWPTNPWTAAYRVEDEPPRERIAGWLSGCCLLLRRSAFEDVGGFDPGYFMYFEDLDLGERLGKKGWRNIYVPSASVTHTRAHATARHAAQMATEHHRSAWRYLSGRYAGLRWLPLRVVLRAGIWMRSVLAARLPQVAVGAGAQREWLGDAEAP